ncbi:MAG: hypothetical protein D6753_01155 [Planctomycetota bacterium]|nr:MAG: hypothetical protein D6753_01155 [Planctomycetota bacterium]
MNRYRALMKETWWLWLIFLVGGTAMAFVSPVFWLSIPICIFTFFWFAFVRYDEDGNFKGS